VEPESTSDIAVPQSTLDSAVSSIGEAISGVTIPAPVRKNALKAFGRLCTALVEIPAAVLEGIAAERRAESQARVKLIGVTAEQMSTQLSVDPRFAEIASARHAQKIVRQQVNLTRVSEVAAEELASPGAAAVNADAPSAAEGAEIDEDWLNVFESEAAEKSSEHMQMLFGKILAGEIRRPKSFSIKAIRLISQLDTPTAQLFKRLCSSAISLQRPDGVLIDVRVCSLGGNAAANSLQSHGLSFDQLNVLQESGLIIADYNSYAGYELCIVRDGKVMVPLTFEGREWGLISKGGQASPQTFRVHGVALSRAGRELFPIVEIEPNAEYRQAFGDFMEKSGYTLQRISVAT
jgi:hypothetical protein